MPFVDRLKAPARAWARILPVVAGLSALASAGSALAQGWGGYGRDAQHTALASNGSQMPNRIRWSTPIDLAPQYTAQGYLLTHYGSPLITRLNTILIPVKTGAGDGFRIDARRAADGSLLWSQATDYALPHHNWIPPIGPTLQPRDAAIVIPAAGGTVMVRKSPDTATGATSRLAFYGLNNFNANPVAFQNAIQISTPITIDRVGNLYFGYVSTGAALPGYPGGIPSGLARISSTGVGAFVSAAALSGNAGMAKVCYNCGPAVSADGNSLYVAVNNIAPQNAGTFGNGLLCRVNSTTLANIASVALADPRGNALANVTDDGTASPTIGPDGDVYYGVLEGNFPSNNDRGWLLHYDQTLAVKKIPGAFGWDDSASIVPATAVKSYTGSSNYLLLTKYNNYAGFPTGNGQNKLAVIDPFTSMVDPITGATVMKEVLTVLGKTPDPDHPGGVREWCINSAAIDPVNRCAVVNSEDGHVYRWSFDTNTLSTGLLLAPPTGEAYTSTLIGPDGAVYAINNASLFCCVE